MTLNEYLHAIFGHDIDPERTMSDARLYGTYDTTPIPDTLPPFPERPLKSGLDKENR